MVLCGPCAYPWCKAPDKASGQWQYIPEDFDLELVRDATCSCKKADCLRYFGLKEAPQKCPTVWTHPVLDRRSMVRLHVRARVHVPAHGRGAREAPTLTWRLVSVISIL